MRDLGLADRLRAQGLHVVEVAGWRERGSSTFNPRGSVNHHTAGPAGGNAPSLGICINGRSDLPGPLCQVLQARDNTLYVIASGRANHAGLGGWRGLTGNSSVYGLEVENVGTAGEPWRPDQIDTMHRVHVAFGVDPEMVCQHREWSSRKPDAHDIDGPTFRAALSRLHGGSPTPPPVEDDMPKVYEIDGGVAAHPDGGSPWLVNGQVRWWIPNPSYHAACAHAFGVELISPAAWDCLKATTTLNLDPLLEDTVVDVADIAQRVLAGLDDVALSDEQVSSIIDAMPGAVKQALREGSG